MTSERVSQRTFIGISMLLFAASMALTIAWCGSMSAMDEMKMPGPSQPSVASGALGLLPGDPSQPSVASGALGLLPGDGGTMSMMWMPMPGQSWPGTATAFLGMWLVMMVAMMLPSLVPMLLRYRQTAARTSAAQLGWLTLIVATAYFFVWTLFGAVAFLIGAAVTLLEMQLPLLARAVPTAIGAIVLIAGALQFSGWKAHHLACCRGTSRCCDTLSANMLTAWRHGLRLGAHCVHCCFGLTAVLLVIGVMDLRAMALVTAAISVERLTPGGVRAAQFIGVGLLAAGSFLIAQTAMA